MRKAACGIAPLAAKHFDSFLDKVRPSLLTSVRYSMQSKLCCPGIRSQELARRCVGALSATPILNAEITNIDADSKYYNQCE